MKHITFALLGSAYILGCTTTGGQTGGETGLDTGVGGTHGGGGDGSAGTESSGGDGSAGTESSGGDGSAGTESSNTGGQAAGGNEATGGSSSEGAAECFTADECSTAAEARIAPLRGPESSTRTFTQFDCAKASVWTQVSSSTFQTVVGYGCVCTDEESRGAYAGPEAAGCTLYGRGGDCLWDGSDFTSCSLTDPSPCESVCSEVESRIEADAQRSFDVRVVYADCQSWNCHSVVEIDGRCYADLSFVNYPARGSYDCSLGAEAILEQYHESLNEDPPESAEPQSPPIDGFVDLSVSTSFSSTALEFSEFGGWAQFFGSAVNPGDRYATVSEGIDECRIASSSPGGLWTWVSLERLTLLDGTDEHAFEEFGSDGFYSYLLDLSALEVEPRFGGEYGLSGNGGGFGDPFEVDRIVLPAALSIHELEEASRFERGALHLTWSGEGTQPLHLYLNFNGQPLDAASTYEVECDLTDDGDFTIPAEIMDAVPDGVVSATFTRRNTSLVELGDKTLAVSGIVEVTHQFALGEACERSEVTAACTGYAEHYREELAACGNTEVPTVESLCPAPMTQICDLCPEYFECAAANILCSEDGFYLYNGGCSCP